MTTTADPLPTPLPTENPPDEAAVAAASGGLRDVLAEVSTVVLGQETLCREVVLGLFAGGNVLIEGAPGLGKTLLVRTLADVVDVTASRIQFTPDLMPADITGTQGLMRDSGPGRNSSVERPSLSRISTCVPVEISPSSTQM